MHALLGHDPTAVSHLHQGTSLTPQTSPTNAPSGWYGPELVVTRGNYRALSLVVDDRGIAHAAASLGRGIVYLTNTTGQWTREALSEPSATGQEDWDPSIAVDTDGSLAIAFVRRACSKMGCAEGQIFLMSNSSGEWSDPEQIASGDSPSLQARDGRFHLAYVAAGLRGDVACESPRPVHYTTNVSGEWTDDRVARHGDNPTLELGSDGRARILFGNYYCEFLGPEGVYYGTATTGTGSFTLEAIPDTTSNDNRVAGLALDTADRPHAIFWRIYDDDDNDSYYVLRREDGWSQPELVIEGIDAMSIGTDGDGAVHILAIGSPGTWYLTNRGGAFQSDQVSVAAPSVWSNAAALAIDPSGRPHLLFSTGGYDDPRPGLWYAVGSDV